MLGVTGPHASGLNNSTTARSRRSLGPAAVELLRSDAARGGFELLEEHASREYFRKDNWLFFFPGIQHVKRNAGPAKLLQ